MKKFTTKKSLGQNFLVNKGILDKIIRAAELDKNDTILEIGPGEGILTEKLAEKASKVIAVEKDRRLIVPLQEKFKNKSVEIIKADILKFKIENLKFHDFGYKIVGNIPYYITSHLLKTIFEEWPAPKLIVLMVQKEVAQRMVAKPPHMNLLALSVQLYTEPKIVSYVSKGSFRPIPKVDSAVIRLVLNSNQRLTTNPFGRLRVLSLSKDDQQQFFKLIKTAFAGKRKQLKNTIGAEILQKTGIRPESRPEELSLNDWLKIVSRV